MFLDKTTTSPTRYGSNTDVTNIATINISIFCDPISYTRGYYTHAYFSSERVVMHMYNTHACMHQGPFIFVAVREYIRINWLFNGSQTPFTNCSPTTQSSHIPLLHCPDRFWIRYEIVVWQRCCTRMFQESLARRRRR